MSDPTKVATRSVYLIGGYEPKSSDAFFKRTRRELARFCETWQVRAVMGEQRLSEDRLIATARVEAEMESQAVGTDINFLVWNEVVLTDFSKPTMIRVAKYVATFIDYLLSGTFFRIVRHAWRFSLYFLYPACMLLAFAVLGSAVGLAVSALGFPGAPWLGGGVAMAICFGLLRWSGRRWFVLHLMDLWSFSAAHLRGKRPDFDRLADRFADAIVRRAQLKCDDEIVLVGHSTGGALILEIAARALAKDPALGASGPSVTVLTVGSTALKIGLHPAAIRFRQQVQTLIDSPAINWIECQAHTDIVNFYKTDPVAAMKLHSLRSDSFPQVHVVRIRDMLQPEIYKKFKFNFFRVHYQFIMANTRRYAYDFFMMCCGERLLMDMLGDSLRYHPVSTEPR